MAPKIRARRLAAMTVATAMGITATSAISPVQAAQRDTSNWVQTNYAFQNNSWAARVTAAGGLRTVRLNASRIDCTRSAGRLSRNDLAQSLAGPIADSLEEYGVNLSGLSGTNVTYREGGRTGSRATNVIGDISVAPPLPDDFSGTPGRIVLNNVTTIADTYKDRSGWHADTDISWGDLEFKLPSSPELDPITTEAQKLVDLLTENGNTVVKDVVALLKQTTGPLEIPGLASFDLGYERTRTGKNFARAGAYGLLIKVADGADLTGPRIELGRAYARTDGRARSGVINGYSAAVDRAGLIDRYGNAKVPCVGTGGKVRTTRFNGVRIPDVAVIGAGSNSYMGAQRRRGGLVSWAKSETEFIRVPALDLRLQNITGRVKVTQQRGRIVERSIEGSTIGSLKVLGETYPLPGPGERMEIPGSGGATLRTLVKFPNGRGLKVASAVIDMPEGGPSLQFGVSKVIIKRR